MQYGFVYESRILLVDDNARLRQMVTEILQKEGFLHIETAADCQECLACCSRQMPDLIILDVGLPDGDGFSLMNRIRGNSDVPVLFLSARDEDSDRLLGLGLGADDYMTKPFLPRELVLRLTAILKRTYQPAETRKGQEKDVLLLGTRMVDFGEGTVRRTAARDGADRAQENGRTACGGTDRAQENGCMAGSGADAAEPVQNLTAKELAILRKLYENRGRIVTFDALSQALWGESYYGYENSLMVHIRRLREKIEENPSQPRFLVTARGLGYKLEKDNSPDRPAQEMRRPCENKTEKGM